MRSAQQHIATLQKRLDHLRGRINKNPGLTFDRAEAGSIVFAIINLQPIADREAQAKKGKS